MMRYNFTFVCRDSKADRNGKAPIEMTIGIGGKKAKPPIFTDKRLQSKQIKFNNEKPFVV